jgi:hypothetical protein
MEVGIDAPRQRLRIFGPSAQSSGASRRCRRKVLDEDVSDVAVVISGLPALLLWMVSHRFDFKSIQLWLHLEVYQTKPHPYRYMYYGYTRLVSIEQDRRVWEDIAHLGSYNFDTAVCNCPTSFVSSTIFASGPLRHDTRWKELAS